MNPPSTPPLSLVEAQAALAAIGADQARSRTLFRYRKAAPFFWLWSALWLCGYGLSGLFPEQDGTIWLVIDGAGVLGTIVLMHRLLASTDARPLWRIGAATAVLAAFVAASLWLLGPLSVRQVGAFIALVVAAAYCLVGIWAGPRVAITGAALGVMTVCAYFFAGICFNLCVAAGGSAALYFGGRWLHRV